MHHTTNYLFPPTHPLRHAVAASGVDLDTVVKLFFLACIGAFLLVAPDAIAAGSNVSGLSVDETLQNDTISVLNTYWTYGANIVAFLFAFGLLASIIFAGGRGWWIFLIGALVAAFGDDAIKAIIDAGSTTTGS